MAEMNVLNVLLKNREGTPLIPFVAPDDTISPDSNKPVQSQAVYEAIQDIGRRYLGEVFAYPGAVPPEGAYLLNGQTITNCVELYPKFWEWLTDNAGEMVSTPVYKAWTMPALSADGTLGGAEYAVAASGSTSSGYNAYKSFDTSFGGASTYASLNGQKTGYLTYYSPKKLKLSQIVFQYSTAGTINNRAVSFVVSGSNDNADWVELASGDFASTANSAVQTVDIAESFFDADMPGYQYYKFYFVNSGGNNIDCPEITLYGQEYIYTDYTGSGNILTLTNEAYEYTLSRTGVCGGFVINSSTGSVRLPKVVNGTLWGADSSNIGQSLAAGLPNIEGHFFTYASVAANATGNTTPPFEYTDMGISGGGSGANHSGQTSFDASRSNPIYGNSDTVQPPAIRVSWCIQVYNAATTLSEQESAQLASQMQMKAQTDFGNVAENIDFIVKHEEAADGSWWYDLYRSGKVVQGGVFDHGALANQWTGNVVLPIEVVDAMYTVFTSLKGGDPNGDYKLNNTINVYAYSETGFSVAVNGDGNSRYVTWRVEGKAATE